MASHTSDSSPPTDKRIQDDNPLLDFSGLPRFGEIRPEHITPALDILLEKAQAAIDHATDAATPATWADVVDATVVKAESGTSAPVADLT